MKVVNEPKIMRPATKRAVEHPRDLKTFREKAMSGKVIDLVDYRGKVVLVEFWTFACWNCKNVEPYVKDWHARYADEGLVVIAVHTPEFEREKKLENVRRYLAEHEITHPVLVDNGFTTWRRYGNRYWPAIYLIDKQGRLRHKRIGEGDYERTESWIQRLLAEPSKGSDG